MKILHVAAEFFPLLKTGGLADVVGALPKAQAKTFVRSEIRILLPGFPSILKGVKNLKKIADIYTFAGACKLLLGEYADQNIYVIEADHLYNRPGSPYHDAQMVSYEDNHLRFGLLGWMAGEIASGSLDKAFKAEIVHAHDWHAGLACAYLKAKGKSALSIFTIHNLAYQGIFASEAFYQLNLPPDFNQMEGLEFYGQISFLKAGLFYADHITTVSPTYAEEITQKEAGNGLHGLLEIKKRNNLLTGILNGVDDKIWDSQHDQNLIAHYSLENLSGKETCKTQLQKQMGLPITSKKLVFGVVSRLTDQKGIDWILAALPRIIEQNGQFVLLGSGDAWLESAFREAAEKYPMHIGVQLGHDDKLSHQFIAGIDVLLMPSRFEPCGLTQLYALKYGTLPLVRATGGLRDTVVDCTPENIKTLRATGFVYNGYGVHALESTIGRAFNLWEKPLIWKQIQENAMRQDFSWEQAANHYFKLYRNLF